MICPSTVIDKPRSVIDDGQGVANSFADHCFKDPSFEEYSPGVAEDKEG